MDADDPIFPIAAAAELAGMHPQTLRQYDRLGLVVPRRTAGKSRRYSLREVAQLREVQRLSGEGVSLEGIKRVLELENEVVSLRDRVRQLEAALANELLTRPGARVFASTPQGDVVPLRHGTRAARRTELVVWRPRPLDPDEIEDAEYP
ncbi:heat shock protein transcriptional repressor HspR [Amnibacterium setariae]|uniref:MerR family transcriptional regulator n=1 Tax=Amnibacterium setariae TaxID=2306585 RepID=A0A3A1U1B3_9MICO|nr:MerR family transcriptional regulator [Amnibacterium setariae]RIX30130.1 MerR family transcriptional regulator [Amnibacterium setariae]